MNRTGNWPKNMRSVLAKEPLTHITSKGSPVWNNFRELFQNPDLIRAFAYRDLRIRYAQTALGFLWGFFQPLIALVAVFIVFYKIAGVQTEGIPYPLFALSGLIFWNYFNFLTTQSAATLIHMQSMIKKIYFNRLSLPVSKVFVGLVDFGIALLVFVIMAIYYQAGLLALLSFPLILLLTIMAGLGLGMLTSAMSVKFRDLQQVLPFFLQLLFFITPVAYPTAMLSNLIPSQWSFLVYLNPMTGILELWRAFLFGSPLSEMIGISVVSSLLLFLAGMIFFVRIDRKVADWI